MKYGKFLLRFSPLVSLWTRNTKTTAILKSFNNLWNFPAGENGGRIVFWVDIRTPISIIWLNSTKYSWLAPNSVRCYSSVFPGHLRVPLAHSSPTPRLFIYLTDILSLDFKCTNCLSSLDLLWSLLEQCLVSGRHKC